MAQRAMTTDDDDRGAGLLEVCREATESADLDGRGVRHSELVRDLAFACWFNANGNAERARRLLA